MLLVGDIGGTKTLLAVYAPDKEHPEPEIMERFPSDDYPSLEAIIAAFQEMHRHEISHAVFGVAGPVVNGRARTTNLPWVIDEQQIADQFHLQAVKLLNDLESVALAIPHLADEDQVQIKPGRARPQGPIGVVAPGTGLGEAFLVFVEGRYHAFPSEGGHTDFGPTNELEWGLTDYLLSEKKLGHVSYEQVCSGIGIPNIYTYLRHIEYAPEPDWLAEALAEAEDMTPIIVNAACNLDQPVDLCWQTLEMFVSILGSEASNLALKLLATGGIYLGGGIPPRILSVLAGETFIDGFLDKGRFRNLVEDIPVHVIIHPNPAMFGAASYGTRWFVKA
jgi:glucokinase